MGAHPLHARHVERRSLARKSAHRFRPKGRSHPIIRALGARIPRRWRPLPRRLRPGDGKHVADRIGNGSLVVKAAIVLLALTVLAISAHERKARVFDAPVDVVWAAATDVGREAF